jgi:hypothetical protein
MLAQNSDDRFLSVVGDDRELDLAFLDIKDGVRRFALREDNLFLMVFRSGSSVASLGQKELGIEWNLFFRCHTQPLNGQLEHRFSFCEQVGRHARAGVHSRGATRAL